MAENSKIEWTTHTFNPWRGCTKVSPGCAHCYAETMSHRNPGVLGIWGPSGTRVVASEATWREPLKWGRGAAEAQRVHTVNWRVSPENDHYTAPPTLPRPRVFCASLADVFEGPETMPAASIRPVRDARARLVGLIARTPHLDWLLLTKRPGNVLPELSNAWADLGRSDPEATAVLDGWLKGTPPANVWLGTSVENQAAADDRIPHLLRVPARVRFLSMEPLLGPVNLSPWIDPRLAVIDRAQRLDWVIVGGESGPDSRPMHPDWVRSLRDQCQAAGVPFFFKQWGEFFPTAAGDGCAASPGDLKAHTVDELGRLDVPTGGGRLLTLRRIGKKAAGRLLDGREWNEVPTAEGERRCRECGINRPAGESNCAVCLDAKTRKTSA